MLTEFKGTFRDRFEGEKEYHITETVKENGLYEYTVFCPFSSRSTTVNSRVKLDQVACNGCLRAYQIYRPQAEEMRGVPRRDEEMRGAGRRPESASYVSTRSA